MRLSIFLLIASLSAPIFSQESDEPFDYDTVDKWSIKVDPTVGYSCFVLTEFDDRTVVRFGFNVDESNLYIIIGNENWASIEYGKSYPITLEFGDETPWSGDADGFSFEPPKDQPYLSLVIPGGEDKALLFLSEFMQERNMAIGYSGRQIANLSLKGSYKAGMKLIECQQAVSDALSDPFAERSPTSDSDPFY